MIDLTEERNQHHLHSAASAGITKRAAHAQQRKAPPPQLAFGSAPSSAESSSTAKSAGKADAEVPTPSPPLTGAVDDRKADDDKLVDTGVAKGTERAISAKRPKEGISAEISTF